MKLTGILSLLAVVSTSLAADNSNTSDCPFTMKNIHKGIVTSVRTGNSTTTTTTTMTAHTSKFNPKATRKTNSTSTSTSTTLSTATIPAPPPSYNYTIINSDRVCVRGEHRFQTLYRRHDVTDGECYPVSHKARSMRVEGTGASDKKQLACKVFKGRGCKSEAAATLAFAKDAECSEPSFKRARGYESFRCEHKKY